MPARDPLFQARKKCQDFHYQAAHYFYETTLFENGSTTVQLRFNTASLHYTQIHSTKH